jgi:hypothetical protein
MDSPCDTARSGGLPHSDIRGSPGARPSPRLFAACHVLHRLSVPRHPPDALLVLRPRPAPSTRIARAWQRTEGRRQRTDQDTGSPGLSSVLCSPVTCSRQRTEGRRQRTDQDTGSLGLSSVLCSPVTCSLELAQAPPRRCSRIGLRIPMPRPDLTPRGDGRTCFTVTTRFTMSREQRTENRRQTTRFAAPAPRHNSRSQCQKTHQGLLSSVLCPLSSELTHACLVGLGRLERPTSRLSGVRSNQLSYRPGFR